MAACSNIAKKKVCIYYISVHFEDVMGIPCCILKSLHEKEQSKARKKVILILCEKQTNDQVNPTFVIFKHVFFFL